VIFFFAKKLEEKRRIPKHLPEIPQPSQPMVDFLFFFGGNFRVIGWGKM